MAITIPENSNSLTIFEGTTPISVSLNDINAEADGAGLADITITVVPTAEGSLSGKFLLDGEETLTFTLQQINDDRVFFQPDGSNTGPSYSIIASTGSGDTFEETEPDLADITFQALNDNPDFETNTLKISEGETVTLTTDNISTTDEESTAEELTYDIRSVSNGFFQKVEGGIVTKLSVSDGAFTQADIDSASVQIQFVHDGSETQPSYTLRVRDSGLQGDNPFNLPPDIESETRAAVIEFVPINDDPNLTKNEISLTEGETIPITSENLAATDVEDDAADLSFEVTAVSGGRFELLDAPNGDVVDVLAAPGAASVSFTQAQIADGLIQFVNDPATDDRPSYTIAVSDTGKLTPGSNADPDLVKTDSGDAKVTFQTVNDDPVIVIPEADNPTPTDLIEDTQVILTADDLKVTDEETDASGLTYTVAYASEEPVGQFVEVSTVDNSVTPITEFTQADINAGSDPNAETVIAFQHLGANAAPDFTLTVTDAGGKSVAIASSEVFNFILVNDEPEIQAAGFTIPEEGATVPLTQANLLVEDEETAAANLLYEVTITNQDPTQPDSFIVENEVKTGPVVTFTQAQINARQVSFVHGGSNFAPDLDITVTDTEVNGDLNTIAVTPLDIGFEPENDLPVVVLPDADAPTLINLVEGAQVTLSENELLVTDEETGPGNLIYTVTELATDPAGQFVRVSTVDGSETPIVQFDQEDLNAGDDPNAETVIAYEHFGGNDAPNFTLTVTDSGGETVEIASSELFNFIPENDEPAIAAAEFAVKEGEQVNLQDKLVVTDEEASPAELQYSVIITNQNPDKPDSFIVAGEEQLGPVTTFNQAQIDNGEVIFVHGGSNFAPDLSVTVTDTPVGNDPSITKDVNLVTPFEDFNDPPELQTLALTLTEGATVNLTSDILSVTDEETGPDGVSYTVTSVTGGQFIRLSTDPDVDPTEATSFSQADINAGNVIAFQHDDSNDAPTFELSVTDGTTPITVTETDGQGVTFTPTNDEPTVTTSPFAVTEGAMDSKVFVPITPNNLSAEDEESSPSELEYTVIITNNDDQLPDGFKIDGVVSTGPVVTFTQEDVDQGLVEFVHGGSNTIADLDVQLTDTFPEAIDSPITVEDVPLVPDFTPTNDTPIAQSNSLTISEGGTAIFDQETLLYTDEEAAPEALVYAIQSTTNGKFQRRDIELGTAEDILSDGGTFTQAEVNAGEIQFVHSGAEEKPAYSLLLTDTAVGTDAPAEILVEGNIPDENFTNVNDEPTLAVNKLTILEGGEVTFTNENLAPSDPDNDISELLFTITDVTGGTFFLNGDPLIEGVSLGFDVINFGELTFEDDGDEDKPAYKVQVSDPLASSEPASAEVELLPDNDPPTITVNDFPIEEGGRLQLNADVAGGVINLQAADDETPADELTFFVEDVEGGTFRDFSANIIDSFTQAELNEGKISFLQNGSSLEPSFTITVKDEEDTAVSVEGDVSFIPENDAPTVQTSAFAITEGKSITLSENELLTTDDAGESGPEGLTYEVAIANNDPNQPDGFKINGGDLQTDGLVTFTQADVNAGKVEFIQGGSNSLAELNVTVTDSFPEEFGEPITKTVFLDVNFTPVNDVPQLIANSLSISEGGTAIFDQSNLLYLDEETGPEGLVYTIESVTNGNFQRRDTELGTAADIPSDGGTFTQAEVDAGEIQFVHNGDEAPPTYTLSLQDTPVDGDPTNKVNTVTPIESNIPEGGFINTFDDPSFDANELTIVEGTKVTFTADNLDASDPDNVDSELRFEISDVVGGTFFLGKNELLPGQSFTEAAIAFGELTFQDDGDEEKPSYSVTVSDVDGGSSPATPAEVTFIEDNDAPTVTQNTFTITEGERLTLNNPIGQEPVINLQATDPDSPEDDLLFQVSEVTGGKFFDFNAQEISEFTQVELNRGEISFLHNGSETVPSFTIKVLDGEGGETEVQGNVVEFIKVNDPPAIATAELTVTEGAPQILTSSNLLANDPDTAPENLTFTISELTGGQFNIVENGLVTAENVLNFTQLQVNEGQVQFVDDGDQDEPSLKVSVSDGEFDSSIELVDIVEFINTNDAPVAVDDGGDGFATSEDTIFTTASVLANDTDEDPGDVDTLAVTELAGQAVAVGDIELASGAIVSLVGDGTISYNPNGQFQLPLGASTTDSFVYTVSDATGETDTGTVTITINGENDAPIAIDDGGEGFIGVDNEPLTTAPLTENDLDVDGDPLRIIKLNDATANPGDTISLEGGEDATVTLNADGTVTYTPPTVFQFLAVGQSAEDEFTYTITDDKGGQSQGLVTITVNGANEDPTIANDLLSFTTDEDSPLTLDVLAAANASDIDQTDELTISSVSAASFGTVKNNGTSLTYTPSQALKGDETVTEELTYTISDGNDGSVSGSIEIEVTGINDQPIARNDSGSGFRTEAVVPFTTGNILGNDTDPEGGPLDITNVNTSNTQGLISINSNGTVSYDPEDAFRTLPVGATTTDTFTYTIEDEEGLADTATVSIGITGVMGSFFDYEQFLRYQNVDAAVPNITAPRSTLPLAQLYDEQFYLNQYPRIAELVAAGSFSSGFEHFVNFGIRDGRNPSILFNEEYYLDRYPTIAAEVNAGVWDSGLEEFLVRGHLARNGVGRQPSIFFDPDEYITDHPGVQTLINENLRESAFQEYIEFGIDQGRGPDLALFDEGFYLDENPGLVNQIAAGNFADGFEHFVRFGQTNQDKFQPSGFYDEGSYLENNPGLVNLINNGSLVSGFQHYQTFGRFEGREVF